MRRKFQLNSTTMAAVACALLSSVLIACTSTTVDDSVSSNAAANGLDAGMASEGGAAAEDDAMADVPSWPTPSDPGEDAGVSAASPEVCDGIDNDENGVVDDLDVGGDGVCDCILIATLGAAGTWGQGDVFSAWLDSRSNSGATSLGDATLTAELLSKYQIIVAQDLSSLGRSYSADEIAALASWVESGGGFLTLSGYGDPSERSNANALLGPFGMSYGDEQILPRNGGSTVPVTSWLEAHPVTDGVSRVGVDTGYPVLGSGTSLAQGEVRDVLRVQQVGEGHVIVWTDEWITYDSEWKDHPDYQVERFWLNMIKWMTPLLVCQVPVPVL